MHKIVNEGEVAVLYKQGVISKVLQPGKHRYAFFRGQRLVQVSVLVTDYVCPVQEYGTKDNLIVRFTIRAQARVSDPTILLRTTRYEQLDELVRNSLCDSAAGVVAEKTLDEVLENAAILNKLIENNATKTLEKHGVVIGMVSPVSVLIPRSLRQAFEAQLVAKKKAIADLEEARGRTATLRHLANAAEMVENRPILLQLLLGQKARNVQFQFNEKERPLRTKS